MVAMASFADKPLLEVLSVEEWERWIIEVGHPDGVRLKLRKKLSSAPGITYDEALDVALCHGWIDGQIARFDDDYTLQAFTPRRRASPWSQRNIGLVERLIAEGRMRPGGYAEIERAKADGRWDAAYRAAGATVPDDLQAALDARPGAAERYAALPAQDRWLIIFRLGQLKRAESRPAAIARYLDTLMAAPPRA